MSLLSDAQNHFSLASAEQADSALNLAKLASESTDAAVPAQLAAKVLAALEDKNHVSREAACNLVATLMKHAHYKYEQYFAPALGLILTMFADKKMNVRAPAKAAALAIVEKVNGHAIRDIILPAIFSSLTREMKWQTKEGALKLFPELVKYHEKQVIQNLPEIIPEVVPVMWDTRKEVKVAAFSIMEKVCIGNKDITPFIPALIIAMGEPKEVPECVHKLASTTFVRAVDAPTLAIMQPVLVRGLQTNKISVKRQAAVIIDNMCKLVEEPEEAALFMPKLLPLLQTAIETVADPECRDVCTRAHKTLLKAGGDPTAESTFDYGMELSEVKEAYDIAVAAEGVKFDDATSNFVIAMCHDLSQTSNFDEATWEGCTSPYLEATQNNEISQHICESMLTKCSHVVMSKRKADEVEEEEGEDLCDCEFSLAYGGMILLNNTRMKLKRGHRYGLCGPNGCGKSTLMRAIDNGQVEGFPDKNELRTVFVEHNLQAEEADLNIVDFIMNDEQLIALGEVTREKVVEMLTSVGFDDELRAKAVGSLSGGWKMKLELARAMLMNADILLLDEPTNHLDVANVAWLEDYLNKMTNVTSLIVSHDSGFLDNVCTNIMHYENRKLKSYIGNLSKFVEKVPEAKSYYELEAAAVEFNFPEPGYLDNIKSKGKRILKMENCTFQYPGAEKPTVTNVNLALALSSRAGVIGPNGAGKSTIIKMLTGETEPTIGTVTKHPNMRFAYVAQHAFHHLEEHLDKTPNEYVQWRYQNGTDKELMMKASRQLTEEDKKQMEKVVTFDGLKRQIKELRSRRKVKKTFEYEVEWVKMDSDEELPWIMRDRLERWGFDKMLQQCDDREAAKANLAARPVTRGVIEKHFEDFGLPAEFATHSRMKGLSGGQKVKVVLGAAMWQNPHILVMDEPTNFLDRDSLGALATAIKNFGGGVVLISHNREFTQSVCGETWVVEGGKLKVEGEVAVDNDTTKIEQKLEETSTDAFGNKVVTKIKRKLTRKERKRREKEKKEALARGDDWESDSDFDE